MAPSMAEDSAGFEPLAMYQPGPKQPNTARTDGHRAIQTMNYIGCSRHDSWTTMALATIMLTPHWTWIKVIKRPSTIVPMRQERAAKKPRSEMASRRSLISKVGQISWND